MHTPEATSQPLIRLKPQTPWSPYSEVLVINQKNEVKRCFLDFRNPFDF